MPAMHTPRAALSASTLAANPGALAITPSGQGPLRFDRNKDGRGVTMLAPSPHLLVVHPSVPANNLAELAIGDTAAGQTQVWHLAGPVAAQAGLTPD